MTYIAIYLAIGVLLLLQATLRFGRQNKAPVEWLMMAAGTVTLWPVLVVTEVLDKLAERRARIRFAARYREAVSLDDTLPSSDGGGK